MTQQRFQQFVTKWLASPLQDWEVGRSILAQRRDDSLMLAIVFESSGFDKNTWSHVTAAVLPLYLHFEGFPLVITSYLHRPARLPWRFAVGDEASEKLVAGDLIETIRGRAEPFLM